MSSTALVPYKPRRKAYFNFSCRKVGGLRFIKLGRLTFMFCLSKEYKPL